MPEAYRMLRCQRRRWMSYSESMLKPPVDILDPGPVSSWDDGRARELPFGSTVSRRAEVSKVAGIKRPT
jgi:hypothetical protein